MKKNKIKKLLNRAFNSKNSAKKEQAIEELLAITASFYSDEQKKSTHSIESGNILCCNETGRVMAVFYNDYDLDLINKNIQEASYEFILDLYRSGVITIKQLIEIRDKNECR